ncbi:hypothetical protein BDZ91DRAFT_221791 [Kalaharituber pfeilii]|nr:hypothetical protein BDZ91DRAFT_221791 [Kalaharituber pfeilii]
MVRTLLFMHIYDIISLINIIFLFSFIPPSHGELYPGIPFANLFGRWRECFPV